jgi:hypothetical protein
MECIGLHVQKIHVLMLLCTSGRRGPGCNFVMTVNFMLYVVAIYRIDEPSDKYRTRILLIKFTGASTTYLGYMSRSNVLHGNCKGSVRII